jgi:tRNA(Ile)-lysidine synthase
MICLLNHVPHKCYIALSGGPDSMALLDFLSRSAREIVLLHFDHSTDHGQTARTFANKQSIKYGYRIEIGRITRERDANESKEEYWRNERYKFFDKFKDAPILTGHNLSDAVEWWIFSSLHGESKLIPYRRNNVIRPLLLTPKKELEKWCQDHDVDFCIDPGNHDDRYMRTIIRHRILPLAEKVNPGLEKILKKKLITKHKESGK